MALSPVSVAAVVDPSGWPMTGIGTYGAVGTYVPGVPGDGTFVAPTGTSLVTRGYVLGDDINVACPDPAAVPLTSIRVEYRVTATADDVSDDYGVGVIDVTANAELPVLSIAYGALLFGGPSGHVFVGQQSTGDNTPGLPSGSTPTPVTIDATFDAAGYTLADLAAGTIAVGALLAPEGGAPSTGADPVVTVDFDDTNCATPADAKKVVPVNARLRQCDLDYLAVRVAEEIVLVNQRNVTGVCQSFSGTGDETLGLPAGTVGRLTYIGDHGTGVVRVSFDGSSPVTDAYPEFNARHTLNLGGVDLGLLVFNGTAAGSDYTVCYEIWN